MSVAVEDAVEGMLHVLHDGVALFVHLAGLLVVACADALEAVDALQVDVLHHIDGDEACLLALVHSVGQRQQLLDVADDASTAN